MTRTTRCSRTQTRLASTVAVAGKDSVRAQLPERSFGDLVHPVVAPEQLVADEERRHAERAALHGGLGRGAQAVLHLGHVERRGDLGHAELGGERGNGVLRRYV